MFSFLQVLLAVLSVEAAVSNSSTSNCRTQPGDPSFPSTDQLAQFNASVDGRLIPVVPSGKFCQSIEGGCPDALWNDPTFREAIPGSMLQVSPIKRYPSYQSLSSTSRQTGSRYVIMMCSDLIFINKNRITYQIPLHCASATRLLAARALFLFSVSMLPRSPTSKYSFPFFFSSVIDQCCVSRLVCALRKPTI